MSVVGGFMLCAYRVSWVTACEYRIWNRSGRLAVISALSLAVHYSVNPKSVFKASLNKLLKRTNKRVAFLVWLAIVFTVQILS